MQQNDIIEPSMSTWSSPIVLVRKKDGSRRFVVDYRRLNDITKVDSSALPTIDDALNICLDRETGTPMVSHFRSQERLLASGDTP